MFIFEGMSGVLSFSQIQTITTVLSADGKSYVNSGISVINKTISYAVKIIMASYGINIIALEATYFIITIGKVVFYKYYFKKHYSWIDFSCVSKDQKLPDRNSYVLTEIAWTIFSSTDLIVLSIFVSTKLSSVYAVYNLVFNNINLLMFAVYSSVSYSLGQNYFKDRKRYLLLHDGFTSVFFGGMTCLMCTAYVMVLPFIRLYTKGVSDVNYIYTSLPIMFSLVQILSWSRYVTGNLSGIAGYAKITSRISLIEAFLNIVCSIVLVQFYGIEGVLFATVIALPVKVVYLTWLSETKILKRKPLKYLMILLSNYAVFGCTVFLSRFIDLNIESYSQFFIYGGIVFAGCIVVCGAVNAIVNPELLQVIKEFKRSKQNG